MILLVYHKIYRNRATLLKNVHAVYYDRNHNVIILFEITKMSDREYNFRGQQLTSLCPTVQVYNSIR